VNRIWQTKSTGARLALSQSLNSARSTDVAVPSCLLTLAQLCANSGWLIVARHSHAIMWGFMLLPGLWIKYLFICLFIISQVLNFGGLKYYTTEIMSGTVMMQARKLWMCQLGMSLWSVGRWPTSTGKRTTSFHGGLLSPRSKAFRFVSRTPGC